MLNNVKEFLFPVWKKKMSRTQQGRGPIGPAAYIEREPSRSRNILNLMCPKLWRAQMMIVVKMMKKMTGVFIVNVMPE